jgi:flagellar basal body-associated protein FliL
MTIELYIAILLTVIVLAIVVGAAALVAFLVQLRRTAKTVETAAQRVVDQVHRVGDMAGTVSQLAMGLAGAFGKRSLLGAGLLYSLVRFFRRNKKKKNPFDDIGEDDE